MGGGKSVNIEARFRQHKKKVARKLIFRRPHGFVGPGLNLFILFNVILIYFYQISSAIILIVKTHYFVVINIFIKFN